MKKQKVQVAPHQERDACVLVILASSVVDTVLSNHSEFSVGSAIHHLHIGGFNHERPALDGHVWRIKVVSVG